MYTFFTTIFDYLFPPREEAVLVSKIQSSYVETFFRAHTHEDIIVLSSYNDPVIRALIHEAKFYTNKDAWTLLSLLFKKYWEKKHASFDYIIPVPLSSSRKRARGYNQVEGVLLSGTYTKELPLKTNILKRTRNTTPQTELTRAARLANMKHAFAVTDGNSVTGKHILIIDDVTTTGATLRAAKAALLPHGPASITLLALAH